MSGAVGVPGCFVDVYPFEGGVYTIGSTNALLRSIEVDKNIRSGQGTFTLLLAPGGPFGPNARPGWLDILTPMSLVVIGMSRMGRSQIVMIGVVRTVSETESWVPGRGVQRAVQVQGADFGYFFTMSNYYTQILLNFTLGSAAGAGGSLSSIDQGLSAGTPDTIGAAWYKNIMAGPNSLMAATTLAYRGSRISFFDMTAALFQRYTQADIGIPLGDNFISSDGTWDDKFRSIFPFPFYEWFVTTQPQGITFPGQSPGSPITMDSLPAADPACPHVVARVNPLPRLVNTGTTKTPEFAMDFSLWDTLPLFALDGFSNGGRQHSIQFDDSEVKNFFIINTMWTSNLFGATNDMLIPFAYLFASWVDTASIHRYGYRPDIKELHWFADPKGIQAQSNAAAGNGSTAFDRLVGDLALKNVSYYEPTPNMARAVISTNLRPDILIGNRFVFAPFKNGEPWMFYIEGVNHKFTFGSDGTTSLTLTRGLPQAIYNDEALMVALHTGNAMRQDGGYTIGLPPGLGQPLRPFNLGTAPAVTGDLAGIFAAPQRK
jgi:hypothetical protein